MTGLQELKDAYEVTKNTYGYMCVNVFPPDEDNEYYEFVFEYQGFPEKILFSYMLYDCPYPENDKIAFWKNYVEDDVVIFSATCYFAVTDLMKAFQNNRDNKEVMDEFIEYLRRDIGK